MRPSSSDQGWMWPTSQDRRVLKTFITRQSIATPRPGVSQLPRRNFSVRRDAWPCQHASREIPQGSSFSSPRGKVCPSTMPTQHRLQDSDRSCPSRRAPHDTESRRRIQPNYPLSQIAVCATKCRISPHRQAHVTCTLAAPGCRCSRKCSGEKDARKRCAKKMRIFKDSIIHSKCFMHERPQQRLKDRPDADQQAKCASSACHAAKLVTASIVGWQSTVDKCGNPSRFQPLARDPLTASSSAKSLVRPRILRESHDVHVCSSVSE
ncbi:hypothetical protein JOL62DRAFT_313128 [Phyllosticta paracitricarpa]|uniref:Uncharacterized protein n=1 Tax=Phyllosticta paracitricarpa TaxID=2016321 RepID=A0ABR1MWW3_9PEZI